MGWNPPSRKSPIETWPRPSISFKEASPLPFSTGMPIGSLSSANASAQYEVAVDKKQLDSVKQQGQNAVKLIQAAAPASASADIGKSLNILA